MLGITVDRHLAVLLNVQIYHQIRSLILAELLSAGDKLPATRELAAFLGVSRNVVLQAYEQLYAEGFVCGQQGSGTYVAQDAHLNAPLQRELISPIIEIPVRRAGTERISFRTGVPALELFPKEEWLRGIRNCIQQLPNAALSYGDSQGEIKLRQAISRYLFRMRGVRADVSQIMITNGSAQAFSMLAYHFLQSDGLALIEDPTIKELQSILTQFGGHVVSMPVDEQGLQTHLLSTAVQPNLIMVSPSHQFPSGGLLPIQRRISLLNYAAAVNCYIVEDDYDSEFRYTGSPVSSLHSLMPERVIYIGSYSKVLAPALRLGYMIMPIELVQRIKTIRRYFDLHTSRISQLILADFIELGLLEKHIRRSKKEYQRRNHMLLHSLNEQFADRVLIQGQSTGLHVMVQFPGVNFTDAKLKQIECFGVEVQAVKNYATANRSFDNGILLGYGHLVPNEIQQGIARLRRALE